MRQRLIALMKRATERADDGFAIIGDARQVRADA
jgi:hypothetical protein